MNIPEGFGKIINDFILDISSTFPEYSYLIKKIWIIDYEYEFLNIEDIETRNNMIKEDKEEKLVIIYNHSIRIFPERFFDIIYENEDIFDDNSIINTEFLPRIVFKHLWNSNDITEQTRKTIWKYLQLILMTIISSYDNKNVSEETAKLFENINEDELKSKLEETLDKIHSLFGNNTDKNNETDETDETCETSESDKVNETHETHEINQEKENENENENEYDFKTKIPNIDDINKNLKGLMGGKLGKLAMEMAEETAKDFNLDQSNIKNTGDIFNQMFKNPGKLINMMKNVGDKIDNKIKSGEINENELMSEGLNILSKMKENGNMPNFQDLFNQMGMNNLGKKNEKMNIPAIQRKMEQHLKQQKIKENMKNKLEKKKNNNNIINTTNLLHCEEENNNNINNRLTDEELINTFSSTNKPKKSQRILKNNKKT
jgi:hypothetical protein